MPPQGIEELWLYRAGSKEFDTAGLRAPQQPDRLVVQLLGQISFDRDAGVEYERSRRLGSAALLAQTRVSRSWRIISVESEKR
jgi:hypothetical protein